MMTSLSFDIPQEGFSYIRMEVLICLERLFSTAFRSVHFFLYATVASELLSRFHDLSASGTQEVYFLSPPHAFECWYLKLRSAGDMKSVK